MTTKFEVGDRVRIKERFWLIEPLDWPPAVTPGMRETAGQEYQVVEVFRGCPCVSPWGAFAPEWLEPVDTPSEIPPPDEHGRRYVEFASEVERGVFLTWVLEEQGWHAADPIGNLREESLGDYPGAYLRPGVKKLGTYAVNSNMAKRDGHKAIPLPPISRWPELLEQPVEQPRELELLVECDNYPEARIVLKVIGGELDTVLWVEDNPKETWQLPASDVVRLYRMWSFASSGEVLIRCRGREIFIEAVDRPLRVGCCVLSGGQVAAVAEFCREAGMNLQDERGEST